MQSYNKAKGTHNIPGTREHIVKPRPPPPHEQESPLHGAVDRMKWVFVSAQMEPQRFITIAKTLLTVRFLWNSAVCVWVCSPPPHTHTITRKRSLFTQRMETFIGIIWCSEGIGPMSPIALRSWEQSSSKVFVCLFSTLFNIMLSGVFSRTLQNAP